jgi:hypothetical protein
MASMPRQKITFAEMRASGIRGLLIYCSDYKCGHWTAMDHPATGRLADFPKFLAENHKTRF